MRNDLFNILVREAIGYDPLTHMTASQERFPPHNIIKRGDVYEISLAVAGFSKDEITVKVDNGYLTVTGGKNHVEAEEKVELLYNGIAFRDFERSWKLGEYIEVSEVQLQDGILTVKLFRNPPEEKKPKVFTIN